MLRSISYDSQSYENNMSYKINSWAGMNVICWDTMNYTNQHIIKEGGSKLKKPFLLKVGLKFDLFCKIK